MASTEAPVISKPNNITNSSQQADQFPVKQFSFSFTTFRPEHIYKLNLHRVHYTIRHVTSQTEVYRKIFQHGTGLI